MAADQTEDQDARASAQLAWLVSWDGFMHAFTREQAVAEFAVTALCRHISRPSSLSAGQAVQCMGCLVAMGRDTAENRWR